MKGDDIATTSPLDDIRRKAISLTFCCPYDGCNPALCPLHEVRKLPYEERLEWCTLLNDEDLLYLDTYHSICLQNRADTGGKST